MDRHIGAQYTFHLGGWDLTTRADYYRQAASFFRVYNTEYDRIEGWDNVNLSVTLESAAGDWSAEPPMPSGARARRTAHGTAITTGGRKSNMGRMT
jgi:hypothetical protein